MAKKTFTLSDLQNPDTRASMKATGDDKPSAVFIAEKLTVTVTRPNGEVVHEAVLEPRGFKSSGKDKAGNWKDCGVGWYGAGSGDDAGNYAGLPLSTGLRISLAGIKVAPGTTVDLSEAIEATDAEE